ncbi:putative transcriptional regulator [Paraburkholderia sp. MM5496-R1]
MARNGAMPEAPYTNDKVRVLSTKAPPELVRQVRELAVAKDCTASVIVKAAIEQYIRENH